MLLLLSEQNARRSALELPDPLIHLHRRSLGEGMQRFVKVEALFKMLMEDQ